jgi:aspartate/methionine/tyrosine aminotransferase
MRRLEVVNELLNKMDNISSVNIEGALYAFPKVTLSKKAIEAAKKVGLVPDAFYCLKGNDFSY